MKVARFRLRRLAAADVSTLVPDSVAVDLQEISQILYQIASQLSRFSHELHALVLQYLGLQSALEFLTKTVSQLSEIPIHLESSMKGRLSASIETTLYRTIEEALGYLTQCVRAKIIRIRLEQKPGLVCCSIYGIGLDLLKGNASTSAGGLVAIREWVKSLSGTISITSETRHGIEILITIPATAPAPCRSQNSIHWNAMIGFGL